MASKSKQHGKGQLDIALRMYKEGCNIVRQHPIFAPLERHCNIMRSEDWTYPAHGMAFVFQEGSIHCHPKLRAEPEVWARAIAHCLLHLGMGHFVEKKDPRLWNFACDLVIEKFLTDLKFGKSPYAYELPPGISTEEHLYERFLRDGIPPEYAGFGFAGENTCDMRFERPSRYPLYGMPKSWPAVFADGLSRAVQSAVSVAAGYSETMDSQNSSLSMTQAGRAKRWFISSYPLLGAIAANFKLIEDPLACQRMEISIAAVSCHMQEIYINPAALLSDEECRFVMAHEFLHAALRHDTRHAWRDAYLWNVACDYVINGWLTEMGLGERPTGLLYDEQFKGMNA